MRRVVCKGVAEDFEINLRAAFHHAENAPTLWMFIFPTHGMLRLVLFGVVPR
jgi:hypothetical protein